MIGVRLGLTWKSNCFLIPRENVCVDVPTSSRSFQVNYIIYYNYVFAVATLQKHHKPAQWTKHTLTANTNTVDKQKEQKRAIADEDIECE